MEEAAGLSGWERANVLCMAAGTMMDMDPAQAAEWLAEASREMHDSCDPAWMEYFSQEFSEHLGRLCVFLPEQAVSLAESFGGDWERPTILSALAEGLGELSVRDPERAIQVSERIGNLEDRLEVLAGIAAALALGNPERAVDVVAKALGLAQEIRDRRAAMELRGALMREKPDAASPEETVRNGRTDVRTGLEPFRHLAERDPAQALEEAKKIKDAEHRVQALGMIAETIADRDPKGAADIFSCALKEAQSALPEWNSMQASAEIAERMAPYDPERAKRIFAQVVDAASEIDFPEVRLEVLDAVVGGLAFITARDPNWGIVVAEKIGILTDGFLQTPAFQNIAEGIGMFAERSDDPERALAYVERLPVPWIQVKALSGIARAVARKSPDGAEELFSRAIALAGKISDLKDRGRALHAIAEALAPHDSDRALELVKEISPEQRAEAMAAVVKQMETTLPEKRRQEIARRALRDAGLREACSWDTKTALQTLRLLLPAQECLEVLEAAGIV